MENHTQETTHAEEPRALVHKEVTLKFANHCRAGERRARVNHARGLELVLYI